MTLAELETLKENKNIKNLVEIKEVKFNHNEDIPLETRLKKYLKKIKNPYYFKSGKVGVSVSYNEEQDKTFSNILKDFFLSEK